MIRSLRTLIAPAFAFLALTVAASADAAFNVSTTIQSVNGSTVTTSGGTSSFVVVGTGATIMFTDYNTTGNTTGAIPSEAYSLTGTYTGPAGGTAVTVSELITVVNINANQTTSSATFIQTSNFTLFSFGLVAGTSTVVPTTQQIGDVVFSIANSNATSAQFGQLVNNGAISAVIQVRAVPEPASIVMMGLGLVGTAGFAARRRLV